MSDNIPAEQYTLELTITTPNGIKKTVTRAIDTSELGSIATPISFLHMQVQGMAYRMADALREDPPV